MNPRVTTTVIGVLTTVMGMLALIYPGTVMHEVLGYAITSDAQGVGLIDKSGEGIERAMRLALERAELKPEDISAVWASASGHKYADPAERQAIERVFGSDANVQMPKLKLGEPMGGGGALNTALALKSGYSKWRTDSTNDRRQLEGVISNVARLIPSASAARTAAGPRRGRPR